MPSPDRNNDPFAAVGASPRVAPRPLGRSPSMAAPVPGIAPGNVAPPPMVNPNDAARSRGPIGNTMVGNNTYRNEEGFTQYNNPYKDAAAALRQRYEDSPLARAAEAAAGTPPQRNVRGNADVRDRRNDIDSRSIGQDYYTRQNEMRNALFGVDSPIKRAAIRNSMQRGYNEQDKIFYGATDQAFTGGYGAAAAADKINSANLRADGTLRYNTDNAGFQAGVSARDTDMRFDLGREGLDVRRDESARDREMLQREYDAQRRDTNYARSQDIFSRASQQAEAAGGVPLDPRTFQGGLDENNRVTPEGMQAWAANPDVAEAQANKLAQERAEEYIRERGGASETTLRGIAELPERQRPFAYRKLMQIAQGEDNFGGTVQNSGFWDRWNPVGDAPSQDFIDGVEFENSDYGSEQNRDTGWGFDWGRGEGDYTAKRGDAEYKLAGADPRRVSLYGKALDAVRELERRRQEGL